MYLGDYPHGAHWSADWRDISEHDEDESYEISGTTIRFMPEDTVTVLLWDENGLLSEDPEWLNRALGLTHELIEDIAAWGYDWNATRRGERFTADQHEERRVRLDAEARLLVEQLRNKMPDTFTVVYRP